MPFHRLKPTLSINRTTAKALRACLLATIVAASIFPSQAQAPGDLRIALVIGNAAYAGKAALVNPGNDAQAMSETLRGLGFTVVEVRDGSKAQMQEAIAKVKASLQGKQGIGMLYYAGHGLQVDWRNYMVPVDAKMSKASEVPEQTVELGQVIDAFKAAGNRMNIVVLDACRDNPFEGTSSAKGLAQLDAPPGTFLAYATAPGNVAEDGDAKSSNGLYTQFLLQELKKPTAKIEDVFKRVRFNVRKQSQGRQIPWESTSLEDDFYFNAGLKPTQKLAESEKDRLFNEEKTAWDKIKDTKNASDLYAFLQQYPNGNINGLAQSKLEQLQKSKTVEVVDQYGHPHGSVFDWQKPGDEYRYVVTDGYSGPERGRGKVIVVAKGEDEIEGVSDLPNLIPTRRSTRSGFLVSDSYGVYDPPISIIPHGELKIGGRATTRTTLTRPNGQKMTLEVSSRVVAREIIESAFGKVSVIRLEVQTIRQDGGRTQNTFWMEPGWGASIRSGTENIDSRGRVTSVVVRHLVARKRGAS
jgi:hypothetical protein